MILANNLLKRSFVFLIFCIGSRNLLVYIAYKKQYVEILSLITLLIGISFIKLAIGPKTVADKQLEWLGDEDIWWHGMRLFHGIMYISFAMTYVYGYKYAWLFLLIDVCVGLIVWIIHSFFGYIF